MHTLSKAVGLPPRLPRTVELLRTRLQCGWVEALGHTFFSDALVFLRDALQRKVLVEVLIDPDDLSRAWIFNALRQRWIEAPNLRGKPR
jgi:predicted cobalt transporter CbtA